MNTCEHYEQIIAEVLFDTPDVEDRASLDAHLQSCAACAQALREMEATLALADTRTRPEPSAAYWDRYYDRLIQRMEREALPDRPPVRRHTRMRRPALQGMYRIAGAAALVAIGVMLGWLAFAPSGSPPLMAEQPQPEAPPAQLASVEERTQQYVRRSKVLLLGLVNFDPTTEDPSTLNMAHQQQIARELVEEADDLQNALSAQDQQRLRGLVSELETILRQIASLEAAYDAPAIEMVQSDVERDALLLKINISEMQLANPEPPAPRFEPALQDTSL